MKKNTFHPGPLALLLTVAILIGSCTGEDGAPGPAGTNGTNGTNGANGADGKNGAGFDEAIAKGNLIVILEGTRPDEVAFIDTIEYRFAPTDLGSSEFYDGTDEDEVFDISTHLMRYQGFDGTSAGGGYINSWANATSRDAANPKEYFLQLYMENTMVVFPKEHKYFQLSINYPHMRRDYDSEAQNTVDSEYGLKDVTITSYTYDVMSTGKLAYRYTATVDAEYNNTQLDLKVTIIADATVYQSIDEIVNGGDRQGGNGRTGAVKMPKAEMKSM